MEKSVSVCIPTYNGEKYLEESLDSIINQTYPEIEIIVVDDRSTDGTVGLVRSYQQKDPRVSLIINDAKLGMVANWNKCLQVAGTDWVKLHFQDDLMKPNTIQRMVTHARATGVRLVLTDRKYFFEDGIKDFTRKLHRISNDFEADAVIPESYFQDLVIEKRLGQNFIGEPILGLIHKGLIREIGNYDVRLHHIVDLEFWLRAGLHEPVGFLPEPLHEFRVHTQSQGKKNRKKKLISVTTQDKLLIACKMLKEESYQKARQTGRGSDLVEALVGIITAEVKINGHRHVRKIVGLEPLIFFKSSLLNCMIAWKSDLRNYFRAMFLNRN